MVGGEDRFAAHDLAMRYVWAADTGDLDATVATFTHEALLVDSDGARHRGEAAIRAYAKNFWRSPARAAAFISVSRYGSGARATAAPRETRVRSVGTCDDLCIKVDGVRRFAERRNGRWNDAAAPWNFPAPTE